MLVLPGKISEISSHESFFALPLVIILISIIGQGSYIQQSLTSSLNSYFRL
jgi:hypothetical protein